MTDSTRRYQQKYYTLQEAASYLAIPEHEVRSLIRSEELPVCFHADTEITGASIKRPDGTIENIGITMHIVGTLKSFYLGQERESFDAVAIEIVEVECQIYEHGTGLVPLKGHKLPTVEQHTGFIQPRYVVSGFIDFIHVESTDWLLHVDDLAALIADQNASTDANKGQDIQGMESDGNDKRKNSRGSKEGEENTSRPAERRAYFRELWLRHNQPETSHLWNLLKNEIGNGSPILGVTTHINFKFLYSDGTQKLHVKHTFETDMSKAKKAPD